KVKFILRFKGREMAYQEAGQATIRKVMEALSDIALVESPPKMEGKQLFALLGPDPSKIKEFKKKTTDEAPDADKTQTAPEAGHSQGAPVAASAKNR
ncbi:MAG TPA: translation initiation factor IF-3 C-terminal domain-containing protein, partial [Bdellovibrionales bacterium]|nr:translation initiation factor IF-3 C-terminal domain-containing protein [Bdellovibrionales bacterium]